MERKSGILLHIATLPGRYGIGSLGQSAYDFIDFLCNAGQSYWQVLPLVPTSYGDSPYQSCCSIAGNEYFIDLDILKAKGYLSEDELFSYTTEEDSRIDYENLFYTRVKLLKKAFNRVKINNDFKEFVKKGDYHNYALFRALKEKFDFIEFTKWPDEYKFRDEKALNEFEKNNINDILFYQWIQFEFLNEWTALKKYANENGISLIGDIPIYVSRDSVECWTEPNLFKLDENFLPTVVAGCPPDYFCAEGQLWGNPIYNYKEMEKDHYLWWKKRMAKTCELFDVVRVDHFRGFDRFYEIPATDKNAVNGKWADGPSDGLFAELADVIKNTKIIAEDLGELDDSCKAMLKKVGYPGMKILSFAFDSDEENVYLPSNYATTNSIVYTGTHDNDTLYSLILYKQNDGEFIGKIQKELAKNGLASRGLTIDNIVDDIIDLALYSKASIAIIPLQDYAHIGNEGRINFPSTLSLKNWSFRVSRDILNAELALSVKSRSEIFNRNI